MRDKRRIHNRFSDLDAQQQTDTLIMGRRYLAGDTLGELRREYGYGKFQIAHFISLLHGFKNGHGPGFRDLRRQHWAAREATGRPRSDQ